MALTLALWGAMSAMAWGVPLTADELNVLREHDPAPKGTFPSQAARELARTIGREGNIDGLRALIDLRNLLLFGDAVGSLNFEPSRHLPEELEALVLKHYGDDSLWRWRWLGILGRKNDKHEIVSKYRTRQLFDLLYAELKKPGNDQIHYARAIVATDLNGIEPELIALLPVLPPSSALELVRFLATRRFAPAVPALTALQAATPQPDSAGLVPTINWALLQIGTQESVQAVLDRIRTLGKRSPGSRAGAEIYGILSYVTMLPAGSRPHYSELRAALPEELSPQAWRELIKLIVSRKERRGIPDLIRALTQGPATDEAINALLALGMPADWRAARVALEGSGIAPERLAVLQKRLGDALADEAGFLAKRRQNERQQELQQSQMQFNEQKNRLSAFKGREPRRYAAEFRALIERREVLLRQHADLPSTAGPNLDLAREYSMLAAFLRFNIGQPDEAIAAFEAAGRLRSAAGEFNNAPLAIADIQRFDRRDPRKAIEQYRLAIAEIGKFSSRPPLGSAWAKMRRVIEHEIAFLERGKTFSGTITSEDIERVHLWAWLSPMLQVGMDPALINEATSWMRGAAARGERLPPEANGLTRVLDRLPASQFQIANTLMAVLQLPPQDILRFFAKHDPAGYITGVLLAMASNSSRRDVRSSLLLGHVVGTYAPPDSVKSAAEDFFRARNIRVSLGPDLR